MCLLCAQMRTTGPDMLDVPLFSKSFWWHLSSGLRTLAFCWAFPAKSLLSGKPAAGSGVYRERQETTYTLRASIFTIIKSREITRPVNDRLRISGCEKKTRQEERKDSFPA